MLRLKVPQQKFEQWLLEMKRMGDRTDIWVMGVNENPEQGIDQLLYHNRLGRAYAAQASTLKPGLVPVLTQTVARLDSHALASFLSSFNGLAVNVGLVFVTGGDTIQGFYVLKPGVDTKDLVILSLPGPHMEQLILLPLNGREEKVEKKSVNSEAGEGNEPTANAEEREQYRVAYDRLAGAIGMGDIEWGFELLGKARAMVVVVIGTGRAGSRIALRLAQSGVGADGALILVDLDVTEPWNVEGMIVDHRAIGLPKVFGVAKAIAGITGNTQVKCLPFSLSDPGVLDVVRIADVIFTAADEQATRLGAAVIASRYNIVHIDVTGGSAWVERNRVSEGGELRGFVPGTRGCLGCQDRYNWQEAMSLLGLTEEEERERRNGLDWHKQRAGSNPDILMPVIGEALQSFWNILRGRITESFWWHYSKNHKGRPVWSDWSRKRRFGLRKCGICGKQSGLGDTV